MGSITAENIQERKLLYRKHQEHFEEQGFTYEIACKLFPVIQQSVWDMFGLFCCAKKIPDGGTYMELGSKWGGSLACVFYASQVVGHKIRMIGVEPQWQKLTLLRKFAKEHDVRLIGGYSHGAAGKIKNDSLDFLFIDGPHNYQTVSVDLKDYWPKIKMEGYIVGHDHTDRFPGVEIAVKEFFGKNYTVLPHSTIYVARKKEMRDEETQA